ncbi:MAG: hypothetical protein VE99_C0001G0076 [candidate division Kazan bacterium GW2011_GWC1_52_13]|uniref:Uncharacterized protein n=1 Tax=candidate division Kazan bacterium GW2011_GWB1_52_7 TaxID=1620414 RepID=A0A0G1X7G0_UNCK3|nr:MAG: hypothetical protein VE99_C0001G0076 [candidate division Kazan bacterium GW2011_GWC1_52_13]KKW26745.1 MAG: hypothetical protein VF00_C0002G0070 [candidate division Kazan bacterium GW2011_GWB1_52_7]
MRLGVLTTLLYLESRELRRPPGRFSDLDPFFPKEVHLEAQVLRVPDGAYRWPLLSQLWQLTPPLPGLHIGEGLFSIPAFCRIINKS